MVQGLRARVEALEATETVRNGEHTAMVDRLDRLYKRISARIARSGEAPTESTLDLRNRLKR
jgi:hypothetical protein